VTPDSTELTNVIADIYDAAIDPAQWQRALASICAYVGGVSAALVWHDSATRTSQALHLFNDDPHFTKLYFEKYLPMDPLFPAATFREEGTVHTSRDIIPQDELEQTRFYKEWIAPQGTVDALAVNLEKGAMRSSMINIRRDAGYGPADEGARWRLGLLVPHLQRAVAIGKLFDQSKAAGSALAATLDHVEGAVILVGADGAIAFANAAAAAMLDDGRVIVRRDGRLHAASVEVDRILRDLFVAAGDGDQSMGGDGAAVPLTRAVPVRWFAHVLPLTAGRRQQAGAPQGATAAVFIRETVPNAPPRLEVIAGQYKLTAGEVRVLDAMLKVNGVRAMAELLGVSEATVKSHLQNLFHKTGTARQGDLIKLVAGM